LLQIKKNYFSDRLRVCLKYTGKLAGADHQQISLKTEIHLDALKKGLSSRAFFSRTELEKRRDPNLRVHQSSSSKDQPDRIEHILTLTKGREHCESYEIYVPVIKFNF
jgi:hypothetical protein